MDNVKRIRKQFQKKAAETSFAPSQQDSGNPLDRKFVEQSDGLYEYINYNGKWYYHKWSKVT